MAAPPTVGVGPGRYGADERRQAARRRELGMDGRGERHGPDDRRAELLELLPVVERLRGGGGARWVHSGRESRDGYQLHPVRYPTYEEDVRAIVRAFDGGALTRNGHLDELERCGLSDGALTDLEGLAEWSDEALTRALVTWVVRSERFSGGAIADAVRDGTLVALLDRLRVLHDL